MTTKKYFLPNDVARCAGVGNSVEGWREDCNVCLRRLAKTDAIVSNMMPIELITFECPELIEAEN